MRLVTWEKLTPEQKQSVKRGFVHWRYDTTVKTFEEWAAKHAFYITLQGQLARRPNYCEPHYLSQE